MLWGLKLVRALAAGGRLGVTGEVACGNDQWQACDNHRRNEPGDADQPGNPGVRLLRSEEPLKADDCDGSAGGQRRTLGACAGQDDAEVVNGGACRA